jgi:hypothetical protein
LAVTPNLKTSKIFKKKIKNTILIMRPEVASALFFFSLQRVQRDDFTGRPKFFFDFHECEFAVLFFEQFETIALFFDTKRAKTPACGPETNFSPDSDRTDRGTSRTLQDTHSQENSLWSA